MTKDSSTVIIAPHKCNFVVILLCVHFSVCMHTNCIIELCTKAMCSSIAIVNLNICGVCIDRVKQIWNQVGDVVYTFQPKTQEVEARGSGVRGKPWLHAEFESSLGSLKPCLISQ